MKLTPIAACFTRTSPARGGGRSISCSPRTSGPPGFEKRIAFIVRPPRSAQMLAEEGRRTVVREFGVGAVVVLAANARECMIHLRIDMDHHTGVVFQPVDHPLLRFGRYKLVLARDVQHQGLADVRGFTEFLLDVHAVISNGSIDIRARGSQVGEQAAKAITDCTDSLAALLAAQVTDRRFD